MNRPPVVSGKEKYMSRSPVVSGSALTCKQDFQLISRLKLHLMFKHKVLVCHAGSSHLISLSLCLSSTSYHLKKPSFCLWFGGSSEVDTT